MQLQAKRASLACAKSLRSVKGKEAGGKHSGGGGMEERKSLTKDVEEAGRRVQAFCRHAEGGGARGGKGRSQVEIVGSSL